MTKSCVFCGRQDELHLNPNFRHFYHKSCINIRWINKEIEIPEKVFTQVLNMLDLEFLLHVIAKNGHRLDILAALYARGVYFNCTFRNGLTPIQIAAKRGHIEVVRFLCENGVKRPGSGGIDLNSLCWPVDPRDYSRYEQVFKILIQHNLINTNSTCRDASGQTALHKACFRGYHDVIFLLSGLGKDICSDKFYKTVSNTYDPEKASLSLEKVADICKDFIPDNIDMKDNLGLTPLYYACQKNHIEIVKYLLKCGADSNTTGETLYLYFARTCISISITNNYFEIVKALVENGADIRRKDKSCEQNKKSKSSMDSIIDIMRRKKAEDTPLHLASQMGHLHIVKYLLENGADPNAIGNGGKTPIFVASYKNSPQKHLEIVQILLEYEANINFRDSEGGTPLHYIQDRKSEIARYLIDHGAVAPSTAILSGLFRFKYTCFEFFLVISFSLLIFLLILLLFIFLHRLK